MSHRSSARVLAPLSLFVCFAASSLMAQRARHDEGIGRCRDGDWGDDSRSHYCEIRESGFKAGGAVSVDPGQNGAIRFTGWDRDSVAVTAKIQTQAETDDEARALARDIRIVISNGSIRADGPGTGRRQSWSVSFEVSVPRRTDLTARTVNGPIAVDDVAGRMELTAVNGPVHLDGVGGDVHARTTNGPLVVTLSGAKWDGTGLDSETSNGPVELTIPANYSAHLETGTVNGPMNFDFPITVQGRFSSRNIETDLGGGGPTIRVVTTNGPLTVRRR
jgi:DUF4097 and DUF4098 domain-containing protein YvlB